MTAAKLDLAIPSGPGSLTIGELRFSAPPALNARLAIDGVVFDIPHEIEFFGRADAPTAALTRLEVQALFAGRRVGSASAALTIQGSRNASLSLQMSAAALREIERLRDGKAPIFEYEVVGELCREFVVSEAPPRRIVFLEPSRVFGRLTVTYPQDAWIAMLQRTGFGESVYVEIGLDPVPSPDWENVYRHVRAARDALHRGGRESYRFAMNEVRDALEEWRAIRAPDTSQATLQNRTEAQRIDALRQDLYSLAHLAAHPHPDDHLRDRRRAVLLVATLAALLGVEER